MKLLLLAPLLVLFLLGSATAQRNVETALLDSPVKVEPEIHSVGGTVCATLYMGGSSLYGCCKVHTEPFLPTGEQFLVGELFAPYRIWQVDETGTLITSWSTAFQGTTMTGVTSDPSTSGSTYWVVDAFATASLLEYQTGTGTATGGSVLLPAGFSGVWGPTDIDVHQVTPTFRPTYTEDIAADLVVETDLVSGSVGCTFSNPDNGSGAGAFGNGVCAADDPSACAGATLVVSSGTALEGQVTRTSQMDCTGTICANTWSPAIALGPFAETFPNGIAEFTFGATSGSPARALALAGNATSTFYVLCRPPNIEDCQGIDSPDSDVLFVNSSRGGILYTETIHKNYPLGLAIQRPPAGGPGKFVVHLNTGAPSSGTITPLPASLGNACFPIFVPPFGTATPVSVWNNLGKTDRIGASNYFGTPIPNPANAPTFFALIPAGDPVNLPSGSIWTLQGLILNPASSSPKGASVTNAVRIDVVD